MRILLLVCRLETLHENPELGPDAWTARRDGRKEEAGHPRSVGGRFNRQSNLQEGLSWVPQDRRISASTPFIYMEALIGFSHMHHPGGLNNTSLSQSYALEHGSHCVMGGQTVYSKEEGRWWGAKTSYSHTHQSKWLLNSWKDP